MLVPTADEACRFALSAGAVLAVACGVLRCVRTALSTVAVYGSSFLIARVDLLEGVASPAWPSRHHALVFVLLYVVHGRVVLVPRATGVDAHEQ
jgi:hypothetical protein